MKITWHGHAFIEIQVAGKQILIDPFITGNPFTKTKPEDFNPDYILLTHSHHDHVGDTEELAKKSGATIVTEIMITPKKVSKLKVPIMVEQCILIGAMLRLSQLGILLLMCL